MAREPPLQISLEVAALANPELGAKQICPACSTKFYDLGRRPAACPKCGAQFDPEEAMRNRRVRVRATAPEEEAEPEAAAKPAESEDGFEAEPDDAPELDSVVDDPPLSADDDADEPDAATPPPGEGLGVDFAEEDDIEEAGDDAVPFIEDEDDTFPADEIDGLPGDKRREDR
ncbi:MAG: TIGR02300 family protein [Caulobacteraceae bacterium]